MFDSIKLRLITWFLAVFSVLFCALGIFLYYELREIVLNTVNEHITSEVSLLAGVLAQEAEHGHLDEGIMEITEAASGEYAVQDSGHYYQIIIQDQGVVGRSPSLGLAEKYLPIRPRSMEPSYETIVDSDGVPLLLLTQTFIFPQGEVTFQAADSLGDTFYVLRSFRNIILIALPLIFLISVTGIYYISGIALGALNVFSDEIGRITERNLNKRVEEEGTDTELRPLARSFNTMMGHIEKAFVRQREFLSDASHELRTPTSVIKSYCDVTLRKERTPKEYREALGDINKTSSRMSSIIERILEASRLESKIFHLSVEELDLDEILSDTVKLVRPHADELGVALKYSAGRQAKLLGDRERLTEVFINIVDNAVKYNKPGGKVEVDFSEIENYVVVSVKDDGIGIPEDSIDKVFDRFYRVDKSRQVVPGSGLGLPIVKAIVESHRGKVEVESTLGHGTCFKVHLLKD